MYYDEVEVREALAAGEAAFDALNNALKKLDEARKLGIFDIIGGGIIVSVIKREKMKAANEYIDIAKEKLKSFNKELRDIDMYDDLKIETNDFVAFADVIFDNFFADLQTQKQIKESIENINSAMDKIEAILDRLEELL